MNCGNDELKRLGFNRPLSDGTVPSLYCYSDDDYLDNNVSPSSDWEYFSDDLTF